MEKEKVAPFESWSNRKILALALLLIAVVVLICVFCLHDSPLREIGPWQKEASEYFNDACLAMQGFLVV
jgi:hypothetical protein